MGNVGMLDNEAIVELLLEALRAEFGSEPPLDSLTNFVLDLLYGPKDLAGGLRVGIVTRLEVANALLDRVTDWYNAHRGAERKPELWPALAQRLEEILRFR